MEQKQAWGKLVSLNPKYPAIDLVEERVVVGRSTAALNITNTAISGNHFQVWRERSISGGPDDWIFFVKDTSTNGTFVNGERIAKNTQILIENGTDVSILNPKKSVEFITFTFLDLIQEQREIAEGGPQGKYEIQQVLGTGQFAAVRLVVERSTGTKFAMKVIEKKKFTTSTKRPDALMDEVRILMSVSHVNVISIKELFQTQRRLYIVLELVTGGELFDSIVEEKKFTEEKARGITRQVLDAIAYLHGRGIAHRDLKPENILLAEKGSAVVKISDFGLSRIIDEGSFMRTMCGTPQYVAPEVLMNTGGYTPAVDLWSIGVILYVMLCGFQPFDDSDGSTQLFDKIKKGEFQFTSPYWDPISAEAKDLIRGLMTVDPKKRLTAAQALAHPWMKVGPIFPSSSSSSSSSSVMDTTQAPPPSSMQIVSAASAMPVDERTRSKSEMDVIPAPPDAVTYLPGAEPTEADSATRGEKRQTEDPLPDPKRRHK